MDVNKHVNKASPNESVSDLYSRLEMAMSKLDYQRWEEEGAISTNWGILSKGGGKLMENQSGLETLMGYNTHLEFRNPILGEILDLYARG